MPCPSQALRRRVVRYVLAGVRWLRQRRARRQVSGSRHRPRRRVAGLRPHRRHHGLCRGAHHRRAFQSRHHARCCSPRGRAKGGDVAPYIIRRSSAPCSPRGCWPPSPVATAPTRSPAGLAANGFGDHSPGGYSMTTAFITEVLMTFFFLLVILGSTDGDAPKGFRAARHRSRAHADSPHQHSHHQHLGEPGAQHRSRAAGRWLGAAAAVAVLGGAHPRRARWPAACGSGSGKK